MAQESKKEKGKAKTDMGAAKTTEVAPSSASARALSPFEEMDRLFERMESLVPRGWLRPLRWERPGFGELVSRLEMPLPKVDVIDRDNEIVVRAEVPGVNKDDLDVSVTDNAVTIKGSTSHEEKEEKGDYFRSEISRGSFSRTVGLPGDVDSAAAKASFKDGVLELVMPKVAKSRRRSIKVE